MRKSTIIKKENVLKLLQENNGVIKPTLQHLGYSRTQFYQWLKDDELFNQCYHATLEIVELNIVSKMAYRMKQENPIAFQQWLKHLVEKKKMS